jgi:hypothetical protein
MAFALSDVNGICSVGFWGLFWFVRFWLENWGLAPKPPLRDGCVPQTPSRRLQGSRFGIEKGMQRLKIVVLDGGQGEVPDLTIAR